MIKNIVFDFGKVLVDYEFPHFLSSFIKNEREMAEFMAVFCSKALVDRFDQGLMTFSEIIAESRRKYPQWDAYLTEFEDRQIEAVTDEIPRMRCMISRLKEQGFGVYGLSNWSETVYPVIEKFEILRMLDGRLISSEERLIKPDVAIYHRFCEKFSLKEEECLFTDDKQINIDGAIAAGMEAVLFKDALQFESELIRRGLLKTNQSVFEQPR